MSAERPMTRRERIAFLLDVATRYFEDGAWLTAAGRLDQAAELLREGHAEMFAYVQGEARP